MDVEALVRPVVESAGLELVDAAFRREGGRRVLRVTVDREDGLDLEAISEASERISRRLDLEEVMAAAYKSWRRQQDPELTEEGFGARAQLDPETGEMRMWEQTLDEEGNATSEHEVEVTDEFKGRIGAQTAKQVIYQKLRDA